MKGKPSAETFTTLLGQPERWGSLDNKTLDQLVHGVACMYGASNDDRLVDIITELYAIYREKIPSEQRLFNYEACRERVEQGEISPLGLLPFLLCDYDRQIVSSAALDFAVLQPGEEDPMSGVNLLLEWATSEIAGNPGAIFGGLVVCGDRRVTELLKAHRESLSVAEVEEAIHCHSGMLVAGSIEFYLDWLGELDSERDASLYGAVAAGLANQVLGARDMVVRDIERSFPVGAGEPVEVKKKWPLKDYAKIIAPRLNAITARETGEPIMPHVLKVWGLI
ncbi:MAG: hypothetical protein FDZ69_04660 [Deltaproteobacteria bacterium]|nr:MAG: hypothetical protein FDZ69_04660 [Deltaproteobacteria bacterium]